MRFMILVRANAESEAGVMPSEAKLTGMALFHEELAKAGVLVDGSGLQSSAHGGASITTARGAAWSTARSPRPTD